MMYLRGFVLWCAVLVVAILNGAFRQAFLVPSLGVAAAHVVSTLMLCVGILVVADLGVRRVRPRTRGDALRLGAMWLALTVAFEFGLGLARGLSWETMLADYDVLAGRVWVLVLATTALAPFLTAKRRHLLER